ncbi:MAG: hypothetical protein ACRD4O_01045 [Bryobacteraceae bacterium]
MKCPATDSLRAYGDKELSAPEFERIEEHLRSCQFCDAQLGALRERANRVGDAMNLLKPENEDGADPASAYAAFRAAMSEAEPERSRRSFGFWKTPAWGAAAVCALVLLFSFAPARSWGQRFLSMLRVQKVAVVPVDLSAVTAEVGNSGGEKLIAQLISDNVTVTMKPGKPAPASTPQAASRMAGFPVTTLDALGTPQSISVTDEAGFYMTLDRERIDAVLDQIGRSDIRVPDSVDGSIVAVHIPKAVHLRYGSCSQTGADTACIDFVQVPSPVVSVPPALNVSALAEAALQVAGMSAAEAHAFCQTVDWSSTLVIPVPQDASSYRTIPVEGVNGTLIQAPARGKFPGGYALIWTKNGIIYSVSGEGSADPALAVAESLN